MRIWVNKCTSFILGCVMLLSVLFAVPEVSAAELDAEKVSASCVKTRDEAVAWLSVQEGARYNLDGSYGSQCSDFTSAYVNYVLTGDPYGGRIGVYNAKEYSNAGLYPSDWQVIQNTASFVPEPGDIFIVNGADARYGHTGVVISSTVYTATVADQNGLSDWSLDYGSPAHIHNITWSSSGTWAPKYFIRPNFNSNYVQPYLSVDKSSLSLDLANKRTETVNVTANGSLPSTFNFSASRSSSAFDTSWGDWNGNTSPITITAKKVGEYTIDFSLKDKTNGETVIATKTISVSVKCSHQYTLTVENPTCHSQGRTIHKCKYCDRVFYDSYTDKLPHNYGSWVITQEAKCTSAGSRYRICSTCNARETQEIPATGHKYESTVIAPSTQEKGYTLHKCAVCGDSYKDSYTDTIKPADPAAPQIILDNKTINAGSQMDVSISIKNNPGIVGMTLRIKYDESIFKLVKVTDGDILGANSHKPELMSPYTLSWSNDTATTNITQNGNIATLTFEVVESAKKGQYQIEAIYDYDNVDIYNKDLESVKFDISGGNVSVVDYLCGDVNSDGRVNNLDRVYITRYLANWNDYQNINLSAADVNADGKVNNLDKVILTRHLANWNDYASLPYKK